MARKLKKGYFVSGQFVAEGSELDLDLKRELKGGDAPSRTELKRESTELQKLGTDLLGMGADAWLRLALPDKLHEALADARRITNFEGKRRQMQYVGKLMRQLDETALARVRAALAEQHRGSAGQALELHLAEQWRDRLISDEDAFGTWITQYPTTDGQQLRTLIRQSRKDTHPTRAGETPRHGKAYRELFQIVREQMTRIPDHEDPFTHDGPTSLT
jgi:ribosome-associated protein